MSQRSQNRWFSSLTRGVPLNRVLVVPFLLQISLAVGLTAWLSLRNGQKAINDVASQLRQEVANRVEQNLENYLADTQQVLRSNQNALQLGLLNSQNLAAWEPYLIRQAETFPPHSTIGISNEQREYLSIERIDNGKFLLRRAGKETGYALYTYEVDRKGQRTQLPTVVKNYDVRSRPFYQTAVTHSKLSFSPIYTAASLPILVISASEPIYESSGKLSGVISSVIFLSEIGDFLRTIRVGKSGQIFILERSGQLVATSTHEEPYRLKGEQPIRLAATQSENSLTQATAQYLTARFGNLNQIKDLQQLQFNFGGKRQFVEVRPLTNTTNLDWLMVVVVPEADFMEQIDRNTQVTLLLCAAAFILATGLGILTARWIAKPIHRLRIAAKAIAQRATAADFTGPETAPIVVQGIDELEGLAQSFNQMSQQLRAAFFALARNNEELEHRVEQRTRQLQQEIQQRSRNEQRLRHQSRALAELANHRAISDGDLETGFNIITEKAATALEVERVSIWLYTNGSDSQPTYEGGIQCVNLYERSRQRHSAGMERNAADYPIYFAALAAARTIAVADTSTDPRVQELRESLLVPENIVSLMDAPIWVGGKVVGLVFHEQVATPRQWTLTEQNFAGSIADFVALTLEVFDHKQTEIALREAKTAAEVANRAKSSFLANMSHELRTPLNAILGITEALQDEVCGPVTEEQRKSLSTLERSGKHLLELINDILDLAKIESGKLELQLTTTSIRSLCDSSLTFVKQQAFQKKIRLSSRIPEGLEPLQIDERRMRQVLVNLLSNAVKFTPEGGEVWIEVQLDTASDRLHLSVVDTGIGISPENLSTLFQPFVQVESSYTRRYSGTGLGLSLVRRIVELHAGSVAVESEVGQGSRFTVILPWHPTEPMATDGLVAVVDERSQTALTHSTAPVTNQLAATAAATSSPLILLAEDNEANVLTITQYLEAHGYRLVLAENGQSAVEIAKSQQPDLILMDVQMPEMNGLEATCQIRADPATANIPIIALTSFAMLSDREQVLASGVDDYMAKPISLKELMESIARHLAQARPIDSSDA